MDNATYDELHLTPVNDDDTYSRLRTTHTNKQNYELKSRAVGDKNTTNEIQMNNTNHYTKINTVVIIMMVILLLISVLSIALCVTTFVRGASQTTEMMSQVEKTTESALARITENISQIDAKLESFRSSISFLKQYLNIQTQMACDQDYGIN